MLKKKKTLLFLSLFTAGLLLLTGCVQLKKPAPTVHDLAVKITSAYRDTPDKAAGIARAAVSQMEKTDPVAAERWGKVTDYWNDVNNDFVVYDGALPGGLPEDGRLCIIVLGYELNPDGSMQEELLGRLRTALHCSEQYPEAFVLCTGGGTASSNPDATEAGVMGAWLTGQGLSPDRLLIEDKSLSTIENAIFSAALLRETAPSVTSLAVVSSSYHVPWGSLLFETELIAEGLDANLRVVSNAAYPCSNDSFPEDTIRQFISSGVLTLMERTAG